MRRVALDIYEDMPRDMKKYISNYGWHFNKRAYEYAVELMKKTGASGKSERINPFTKAQVDELLRKYDIHLQNNVMYDYVYIASMCKADYYGSSIEDEKHLALFIKDTIDDIDASSETSFRRWAATMVGNGCPIDWLEIL